MAATSTAVAAGCGQQPPTGPVLVNASPPAAPRPEPPTPAAPLAPEEIAVPRPQSPTYNGGGLEEVAYIEGRVQDLEGSKDPVFRATARRVNGHLVKLAVQKVATDPCVQVPLYTVKKLKADGSVDEETDFCERESYPATPREACDSDPVLTGKAIAVPGYWDRLAGTYQQECSSTGQCRFTLSCITGSVAKCVHWGYVPGRTHGTTQLLPYFKACVHASRAHYLDDGKSFTCNDTPVDMYDKLGIQRPRPQQGMTIESLWGEDRLHCPARTRYAHCNDELAGGPKPDPSKCLDLSGLPPELWPKDALVGIYSRLHEVADCPMNPDHCPR
ncbi:ADYC domain-containing protein [Sorangium sp. So ce307]